MHFRFWIFELGILNCSSKNNFESGSILKTELTGFADELRGGSVEESSDELRGGSAEERVLHEEHKILSYGLSCYYLVMDLGTYSTCKMGSPYLLAWS